MAAWVGLLSVVACTSVQARLSLVCDEYSSKRAVCAVRCSRWKQRSVSLRPPLTMKLFLLDNLACSPLAFTKLRLVLVGSSLSSRRQVERYCGGGGTGRRTGEETRSRSPSRTFAGSIQ
ncbi:hypothetical protein BJY59DRAFT_695947 [Rhodotorula toruloides]